MTKNSFFSSLALQNIDLQAKEVINSRTSRLDSINSDTKFLEERCKAAAIPFTFFFQISSSKQQHEGFDEYHEEINRVCKPILTEFEEHYLVWGKHENDQYRLLYQIYTRVARSTQISDTEGNVLKKIIESSGEHKLSYSKPLLETKSQVRIKCENELPHFYQSIIEALKNQCDKDQVRDHSPSHSLDLSF